MKTFITHHYHCPYPSHPHSHCHLNIPFFIQHVEWQLQMFVVDTPKTKNSLM